MQQQTQWIAHQFKQTLAAVYGEELAKVILFGSHARGDFHEESDIDFLVVLDRKHLNPFKEIRKLNAAVYDLTLASGQLISFLPTTLTRYESFQSPFYVNVRKDGITI
ncbi:MAG: nucleotidyltransferase domain-containing protein [Bacteroidota bacterium]